MWEDITYAGLSFRVGNGGQYSLNYVPEQQMPIKVAMKPSDCNHSLFKTLAVGCITCIRQI